MKEKIENKYMDIINLPHHISKTHSHMSIIDRAAQFAPFAALTGYDGVIKETARLTENRIELDEEEKKNLNEKIKLLHLNILNKPQVEVIYFKTDERKEGGEYISIKGVVTKIDIYEKAIIINKDIRLPLSDIIKIEIN